MGLLKNTLKDTAVMVAISNLGESFVKNVFCDIVKPKVGSVVKVDLVGGLVDHSGIYVGRGKIVEVTNIDGKAMVRKVSTEEFINGLDTLCRTGVYIYVACKRGRNGKCIAMGAKEIADRANAAVGHVSEYNLVFNNCHMFTEYCITGEKTGFLGTLGSIEEALEEKFIREKDERLSDMWRSTGIAQ